VFRTIKFIAATGSIQLLDVDKREQIERFQPAVDASTESCETFEADCPSNGHFFA
jgi:hypothetical protein